MSAINREPVVQALSPHVLALPAPGIGTALMESAVTWAEELGIAHVTTAAAAASRNANRFMARIALGPQAVFRASTTHTVRAKLSTVHPPPLRITERATARRHLGQVLAARRQLPEPASPGGRTNRAVADSVLTRSPAAVGGPH